jgi:hypothetical protein
MKTMRSYSGSYNGSLLQQKKKELFLKNNFKCTIVHDNIMEATYSS